MMTQVEITSLRKRVSDAIFERIACATWIGTATGVETGFSQTGKKVKLFHEAQAKPSFYLHKSGEVFTPRSETPYLRSMRFDAIIYHDNAKNYPDLPPSDESDAILSAVEAVLQPHYADEGYPTRNTLGEIVHAVTLDGEAHLDHGDIDGEGMLRIPIRVILP